MKTFIKWAIFFAIAITLAFTSASGQQPGFANFAVFILAGTGLMTFLNVIFD